MATASRPEPGGTPVLLPDGAELQGGRLAIGGCDVGALAARFGTPLLILDRATIDHRLAEFAGVLGGPERVVYAGKALLCVALCELLDAAGASLDVGSAGELATALAAGFPAERIVLHGNNKSLAELETAAHHGVGRVVLDSFDEIARVAEVRPRCRLLVRVTPGVAVETHEFIRTGQEGSKFGFPTGPHALEALRRALALPGCDTVGVHLHLGSQIVDLDAFARAAERIAALLARARDELGFVASEIDAGGGFGIAYTPDDRVPPPERAAKAVVGALSGALRRAGLPEARIYLEPGRAIVGPAGVTVYTVGTVKRLPGRTWVAVDGGMADNPRPMLYGARYHAFDPTRIDAPAGSPVSLAGRYCESGDVLVHDAALPEGVAPGDLVCLAATGAYTYAMASNYNRVGRPAVVLVDGGVATEIVARETPADLLRLDRHLDGRPAGWRG